MYINKIGSTVEKQAEEEYAASIAAHNKAVQDYNIMMGNLEDPSDEEEEEIYE